MLFNLIFALLVLTIPFVAGLTLYRGGGQWKALGVTLMFVPLALVALTVMFLVFAAATPFE